MGFLRKLKFKNEQECLNLWLCEKELEKRFRGHLDRRLPQSFKMHLTSKYNLPDSDVLLASRHPRRCLRIIVYSLLDKTKWVFRL